MQCYLCPSNTRANGSKNPAFDSTFVFVNDYSAVKEHQPDYTPAPSDGSLKSKLLRAEGVTGKCYVICFSPNHNVTLADMAPADIVPIIETWTNIYKLHLDPASPLSQAAQKLDIPPLLESNNEGVQKPSAQYRYMQIFENKGETMGCSAPHPHGQVWTTTSLPEEPSAEMTQLLKWRRENNGSHMLVDYASLESEEGVRTVFENEAFWAGVPYWAVWPYEIMIVSKTHKRALVDFNGKERKALAECIAEVSRRYDNLFETQFPYSKSLLSSLFSSQFSRIEPRCLTENRYGPPPSSARRHRRGDRGEPFPYPFLPASVAERESAQVSGWI